MNAVVSIEPQHSPESTAIIAVIERAASNPNVDIDKMERLLQMQERILDRNARASYASALAQMQPQLPIIAERGGIKDRSGSVQSRYALWEDIVGVITPILAQYGFALSFRTGNDAGGVTVTGVLSHRDGHSESTSLTLPIDTSGSKNAVQSVGSSTSYGKRYTSAALLNLRTGEIDDDGQRGGSKAEPKPAPAMVTAEQIATLEAMLTEIGKDAKAKFLEAHKYAALADIKAADYRAAFNKIDARRKAIR